MSENQGIHIDLTAETSVFTAKMRAAQQTLTGLKNEVSTLKSQEERLEGTISSLSSQIEKKRQALDKSKIKLKEYEAGGKGASESAEKLRDKIKKQEAALKSLTDKLDNNSRDLKENASAQDICADKIKLATIEVDRLTKEYSDNTSELNKNETANKNFTNTLKTGLTALKGIALAYAGRTLYSALIGSNAEFEQYMTNFEVLLQSSEKAEAMMSNLEEFGASTPFELPEITSATEQLLAFGVAEEDVMTRLQQLGDLSKGQADILTRITSAYGKMQAKGKVTLEELNMMTEAGIPILRELASQLGVTTEELFDKISKGEIGIENINAAMESLTSEGGQFFGMMEKQSQTMSGMMSTLSDTVNMAMREMGEGAFEAIKEELGGMLSELQRMSKDGSLSEFAAGIGESLAAAIKVIANIVKAIYNMRDALKVGASAWIAYKAAMMIMSTINGVKTAFNACKVTMGALHDVTKKNITAKQLFKAKTVEELAATKASTTATKAQAAANTTEAVTKGAQASATKGAEVAQHGLNAAMKANPIGLIVSALAGLISMIGVFADKAKEAEEEARRNAMEAGEKANEELESVKALVKEYSELRTAGDWDNSARERAKEIQEEITKLVGEEVTGLDDVNGKLEDKTRILAEALLNEAKDNKTDSYNSGNAALNDLWDYYDEEGFLFPDVNEGSELEKRLAEEIKNTITSGGGIFGGDDVVFFKDAKNLIETLEKIIEVREELISRGEEEGTLFENLNHKIEEYKEKYNQYIEKSQSWRKNEATILMTEYVLEHGIDTLEEFDEMMSSLENGGNDADDLALLKEVAYTLFPQYTDEAREATRQTEEYKKSASGIVDTANSIGDSLSSVSDAQSELNKNGKLSTSTIGEIKENFSGLGTELDGYIERLVASNGNSAETKKILAEMADELIKTTFSTDELVNADVNLIASMLEEAGVANSLEYATQLVSQAKINAKSETLLQGAAIDETVEMLYREAEALGLDEEATKKLIAQKILLAYQEAVASGKSEEFMGVVLAQAQALGYTNEEMIQLIATNIQFNSTKLDVSDKVEALYELARAAGYASTSMAFCVGVDSVRKYAGNVFAEVLDETGDMNKARQAYDDYIKNAFDERLFSGDIIDNDSVFGTTTPKFTGNSKDGSGGGSKNNEQKKAYEDEISEFERLDERYYKQQKEYGKISDEEYQKSIENRAARYRGYADEVLTLAYLNEEEKAELHKKYTEKAEDVELEAYKNRKTLWETEKKERESAYKEQFKNSQNWLNEQVKAGNFDAVYDGYERVSEYTKTFYEDELSRLQTALDEGVISAAEYAEMYAELTKSYGESVGDISDGKQSAVDSDFSAYITRAKKYISDRNLYGDWAEWGDNEAQAMARMYAKFDEYRKKGVSDSTWITAWDDLNQQIFKLEKDNLLNAINEEEQILRDKYQKQYDMKKEAAEKELEIAQTKAESEIEAINERADAEIKRIDELIRKRKEAREDEDYNLRMQRLQMKLEYEMDENNRIALEKEIAKLKEEIADTQFDREMERQKALVEEERESAIAAVNNRLERENSVANRKITLAENTYNKKTDDTEIAKELMQTFNSSAYKGIFETLGIDFTSGIANGLKGIISALNEKFNSLTGADKGNYDYSTNSNTYNMYTSFASATSSGDITRALRTLLDKLELEARS